jgi:hypothetical protein
MPLGPLTTQAFLLTCGIVASLLKVGADILAISRWRGYSFVSQSISELSAAGSPTRALVLPLDIVYDMLMIAFASGIFLAADNTLLRGAGASVAANAIISLIVILLIPMRIAEDGSPSVGTVHVILMAIAMVLFLLAIGLGGAGAGGWITYYSYGTLLAFLVLAIARMRAHPRTPDGAPAVTVGAQERTMVLGYLLWAIAFAVHELRGVNG